MVPDGVTAPSEHSLGLDIDMKNNSTKQQSGVGSVVQLDGQTISTRAHLTKRAPTAKSYQTKKSREWYCRGCGNRVTTAVSRSGEWGHDTDCEHHISGGVFGQ